MGVPIVLEYAVRRPQRIHGILLLDYPARYSKPPQEWVDHVLEGVVSVPEHVIRALHQEAEDTTLWDQIDGLSCPTLVIRGGREDGRLTPENARRYLHALPNAREAVFENAGQEVADLHMPDGYKLSIQKWTAFPLWQKH